jgi:hypothetical protein
MKLTRNQRRQMKKLAPHLGRIAEVEIAQHEIASGEFLSLSPGHRHFVIIPNVTPRRRPRLFVTNAEDAGTDVPEDLADVLFDMLVAPQVRRIEAALRAASPQEGGAA